MFISNNQNRVLSIVTPNPITKENQKYKIGDDYVTQHRYGFRKEKIQLLKYRIIKIIRYKEDWKPGQVQDYGLVYNTGYRGRSCRGNSPIMIVMVRGIGEEVAFDGKQLIIHKSCITNQ